MAVFYEYNREAAVSYARRWALGRNPAYMDYELWGGDCTNFISQCFHFCVVCDLYCAINCKFI